MHGNSGASSAMNASPRPLTAGGNPDFPSSSGSCSRGNTKRMFQDALAYSKVHYEQDAHHLTFHDHHTEMAALIAKTSFSLEEVIALKNDIVLVLTEENERLEEMIAHLQYMMEDSMETGLETGSSSASLFGTASTSPPRPIVNSIHNKTSTSSSSSMAMTYNSSSNKPLAQFGSPKKPSKHPLLAKKEYSHSETTSTSRIPTKSTRELQESFERITIVGDDKESLDKYLSEEVSVTVNRHNNNHSSPSGRSPAESKSSGGSKFRRRLQGATSELFLVDDF